MLRKLYLVFIMPFALCGLAFLNNPPSFGDYSSTKTAYIGSASSQATIAEFFRDEFVNGIKGESCRVAYKDFDLQATVEKFCAELVAVERVGGIVSYYYTSPLLKRSATLFGKEINLHIAVGNEFVTLGTPLIYGSY